MPGLSQNLKQLDQELLALGDGAMVLEELDGFVAGLLVCPELILPGEWLPIVWNPDGDDQQPGFENLDHVNRLLGLIMEHYNHVALTLLERPDRYSPLFAVDQSNGDILWELWIEGFERAIQLRPAAWQKLLVADSDTAAAMSGMRTLADIARGNPREPRDKVEALSAIAPDKIACWVVALNAWRLANVQRPKRTETTSRPVHMKKTGRNDPCPCGSGKKYKRCCGLN